MIVTPLTPIQEAAQEANVAREGYFHRVLVALDIFANVVLNGIPDETISSRCSRAAFAGKWWGIVMCWFLNLFQANHGPKAQAGDIERAEKVIEVENEGNR